MFTTIYIKSGFRRLCQETRVFVGDGGVGIGCVCVCVFRRLLSREISGSLDGG